MSKNHWTIVAVGCSLLLVSSCGIRIDGWPQAKYERTVRQQVSLARGSTVVAETSSGSVNVAGADIADCNVIATICARAPSEEEAQELAEQVKITLEPTDETLTVGAEKPHLKRNRSISISYSITVPTQTGANCRSSYGSLDFVAPPDFAGQVELRTSYGSIKTALPVTVTGEISKKAIKGTIGQGEGKLDLQTRSGSIHLK
jgi:hypothetical protein